MLSLLFAASNALAAVADGLPTKAPSAVGMSAARLARIDDVVKRGIRAGGYPGAAVVVGRRGASVVEKGFGRLGWSEESGRVVPQRTIYDVASLTKVVATTTAIMLLYDQGRLSLDHPVARFLPEFANEEKRHITIRHLLTHRSGLPAGRDIWRIARTPAEARAAVLASALRPGCAAGQCYVYSDLGADVLAFVAEAVSGQRLDVFLHQAVYQPLGMHDTFFRPSPALRERIAPTEVTPPRGYPIRGEVHDENAYALGGVAGHAGLFSTARDLAVFAQMMLNGGTYNGTRVLSDSTVKLFTARTAGTRALGWDTCQQEYGCGQHLDSRAYGHTGFTGTSMWIDPERDMFVILLTNRVHAATAMRPAKVISDVRADLADAAALAVLDYGATLRMPKTFRAERAVGWNNVPKKVTRTPAAKKKPLARKAAVKTPVAQKVRRAG